MNSRLAHRRFRSGQRQAIQRSGSPAVVLCFGWFFGPGAKHSEEMVAQARHHIGLMLGPRDSHVSVIHLADASSAVTAPLKAPAGTFNIVDDQPLTKCQFVDALAAAAGTTLWVRTPGRWCRDLTWERIMAGACW